MTIKDSKNKAITYLRTLWAGFLIIEIAVVIIALFNINWDSFPFAWIFCCLTGLIVVAGFFGRNQIYKKHWKGNVITPRGYLIGNIILFIALAFVIISSALALRAGMIVAGFVGIVIVLFLQLVNFPTGKPMQEKASGGGRLGN